MKSSSSSRSLSCTAHSIHLSHSSTFVASQSEGIVFACNFELAAFTMFVSSLPCARVEIVPPHIPQKHSWCEVVSLNECSKARCQSIQYPLPPRPTCLVGCRPPCMDRKAVKGVRTSCAVWRWSCSEESDIIVTFSEILWRIMLFPSSRKILHSPTTPVALRFLRAFTDTVPYVPSTVACWEAATQFVYVCVCACVVVCALLFVTHQNLVKTHFL